MLIVQALAPDVPGVWADLALPGHWLPRRRRACPSAALDERVGTILTVPTKASKALVVQWCAMPHPLSSAGDFAASELAARKADQALTVSVCLPARNEVSTVGPITTAIRERLIEETPLVDEILVLDDRSTDGTAEAARNAGADVVAVQSVLPEAGPGDGKGNALWKSLFAGNGDLVCWVDSDIRNFDPAFVVGLLGPLLSDTDTCFTKGFYHRPVSEGAGSARGGRVTELMARPVISRFFPALTRFVQPLAGEYAGRRRLLETLPFVEGWGVELGLLIDVVARVGVDAVAQVDLGTREHRNRPLSELGPQATAILTTALRRAGVGHPASDSFSLDRAVTAELVRFDDGHGIEHIDVNVAERPPIIEIPAYRAKFGRELSA